MTDLVLPPVRPAFRALAVTFVPGAGAEIGYRADPRGWEARR